MQHKIKNLIDEINNSDNISLDIVYKEDVKARMNNVNMIKAHFESEAREFDELILKIIPFYNEMLDALVSSIPFPPNKNLRVIDLGCGTGTVARKIKENFVNSKITCLDLAENMIEIAKVKLQQYNDTTFQVGNFYDFEFEGNYDVVVSSLALHHLESDEDKKNFYLKIYKALAERGVFLNADVVLASNEIIQDLYLKKWKLFMKRNFTQEEIDNTWIPTYEKEDSPTKLIKQINYLEEIGFKEIDVIWKYYNFAVFGGIKY